MTPIKEESAFEILASLGIAVFERDERGGFVISGVAPRWLRNFRPANQGDFDSVAVFPFLETFIEEAEEFWARGEDGPLCSDTWTQDDDCGREWALEAIALRMAGREVFVLRTPGVEYEHRRAAVQAAHGAGLALERLQRRTKELRGAYEELTWRNRETERVSSVKSEFLANMSHELRTPLNAIIGFSALLQENAGPLNPKQRRFVDHVEQAATHLLALIDDVLNLSKIEAGRLELKPEVFTVGEVLEEVLSSIRPLASAGLIRLETDDCAADLPVYADRLRFRQVLYNLLSNAVKFTPENGQIRVEASRQTGWITLRVSDTGIGIADEDISSIFEKFYRGRSGGQFIDGTGLGLAISKQLVEQHGGSIGVESAIGRGTSFWFTVPSAPEGAEKQKGRTVDPPLPKT